MDVPPHVDEEYYRQWELAKRGDERAIILEPYLTFGGAGYGKRGFGGNTEVWITISGQSIVLTLAKAAALRDELAKTLAEEAQ
jgi:hypothetical protein